jgi:hypothetical protein
MISDMVMQKSCIYSYHKRENHMPDLYIGRTDFDFPDCSYHGFELQS